jgi:hypothetical protein
MADQGSTVAPVTTAPTSGPTRVSEERFAKMSPAERIDYCRQFPQILPTGIRGS